jgi:hypothetical protein
MQPKARFHRLERTALLLAALLSGRLRAVASPIEFSGHTQGTTYSIRGFCRTAQPTLHTDVDRLLRDVVATMYDVRADVDVVEVQCAAAR